MTYEERGKESRVIPCPALLYGDGVDYDLTVDVLGVHSGHVDAKGEASTVSFVAEPPGSYTYYCTLPGHREAGMEGLLIIEQS